MGRKPTHTTGPVVAVDVDGKRAAWCEGVFSGDADVVAAAKEAAKLGLRVEWGRLEPQRADAETPLGALTALMAYDPWRTGITLWPDDLRAFWESERRACLAERVEG